MRSQGKWFIALGSLGFLIIYYIFLITRGDFNLFAPEPFGMTSANVWAHLLDGRWDIDKEVNNELFLRDGKYYVYFGIFTAFVRGFLTLFIPINESAARVSALLALLVLGLGHFMLGLELGLHRGKARKIFFTFLAVLLLGSPYLYITAPAFPYHEVILWGAAQLMLFYWLSVRFLLKPQEHPVAMLCLLGVVAGGALLSRVSLGYPAFIFLAILGVCLALRHFLRIPTGPRWHWVRELPNLRLNHLLLIALVWIVAGGSLLYVNYKRFGNPFEITPIQYHVAYNEAPGKPLPRGEAFLKNGSWDWDRYPAGFEYYFLPHADNFSSHFPFIVLGKTLHARSWAEHIDYVEAETQIPLIFVAPVFLFLAGFGIVALRRQVTNSGFKILVGASFSNWILIFGFTGFCLRYTIDLIPALTLTGMVGLSIYKTNGWVPVFLKGRRFLFSVVGLSLLTMYSCLATYFLFVLYCPYIPTQAKIEFLKVFGDIFVK